MRIIAGLEKGRKLATPDDFAVRPTTDKVKENIFNILQFSLPHTQVLDLFSGTGQLGLEALSRGANFCTFVEKSKKAFHLVQENINRTKMADKSKIILTDAVLYLNTTADFFDIVLADPPYHTPLLRKVIEILPQRLNENGIILCEHSIQEKMPERQKDVFLKKQFTYGKIMLSLYKKEQ